MNIKSERKKINKGLKKIKFKTISNKKRKQKENENQIR
jgi:hypothetical protein